MGVTRLARVWNEEATGAHGRSLASQRITTPRAGEYRNIANYAESP